MKIQCDVCSQNEASVYCSADEAALCSVCDECVHHANKLAGKHPRFSLHHPTLKDTPICDICQEKKAFLFCQQDRAILCKDCDGAIHKANQHTQNHNRFLLTGDKLSPKASLYSSSSSSSSTPLVTLDTNTNNGVVPEHQEKPLSSPIMSKNTTIETANSHLEANGSGHGSDTSISEYLIDMLPGWHVEDFLDPSPTFSKKLVGDKDPIWDNDKLDGSLNNNYLSPESMGIWVPQAPPQVAPSVQSLSRYGYPVQQLEPSSYIGFGDQIINGSSLIFGQDNSYYNFNKMNTNIGAKESRKWTSDNGNCFTVPQISPPSTNSKRPRTLWH